MIRAIFLSFRFGIFNITEFMFSMFTHLTL